MAKGFTEISNEYLAGIDQEIERLQTLKTQITELLGATPIKTRKAGRPAGVTRRRILSPEARERIAAAQRKRWAQQKRAAKPSKKVPSKATKKAAAKKPSSSASA